MILTSWKHPTKKNGQNKTVKKPEVEWKVEEDRLASSNSKALNAFFSVVDVYPFTLSLRVRWLKKLRRYLKRHMKVHRL